MAGNASQAWQRRIAWAASGLGVLGLLAATVATPALLTRLSSDGLLSVSFLERVRLLRLGLGGFSSFLVIGGCRRWGGRGIGFLATMGCVGWLAILLHATYPHHLLGRPLQLLKAAAGEELLLSDYAPISELAVPAHEVARARYPVINIHAHFRRWVRHWTPEQMAEFMADCNVERLVDLDGGLGKELREELAQYAQRDPARFTVFATFPFPKGRLNWDRFQERVAQLEEAKALGAAGIKIWKNLGLYARDERGVVPIDDPRLDPLWAQAGRLGLPLLIHVGDLHANFEPLDRHNERYEFLNANKALAYHGWTKTPSLETILSQFERMVARHSETTFILAHLGHRTDDLREAGAMLDRHPNLFMDISARVQELGRQPHTARAFFLQYQDRLVFGTDGNPGPEVYRSHFRFLETADEYFDYPFWPMFNYGRWKIYGVDLPDEVLRKLYHDNAARLLGLPLLPAEAAS